MLAVLVEAGRPMILRDLAEKANLAPAQAHAYLASFRRIDLVEQDALSGLYSLGPLAMRLGMARMRSYSPLARASDAAIDLCKETELMVCVVVWGPQAPTVIQVQEGARQLNLNIREGTQFSVTGTASGRLFVALSSKRFVEDRLAAELSGSVVNQGANTRATREELEADFATIREQGFATTAGRPVPGINAVAAPVFDTNGDILLALTIIGTPDMLKLDGEGEHLKRLLSLCRQLSTASPNDEQGSRSRNGGELSELPHRTNPGWTPGLDSQATEGRGVQSIEVGARLLNALVEDARPMMLRDLAKRAEIAPAQAHAYLVSFRHSGIVEQDTESGLYRLGPFPLQLAIARMRSFDPLRTAANTIVELAAETGLTVALAIWGTFGPTVIQVCEGADQVHISTRAGTVYSVTGTATGRVFGAFLPESLIRETIKAEQADSRRSRRIGSTVSYRSLKPELEAIRTSGLATIKESPIPGINALSAPVFDHVGQLQMAVTLIGPVEAFAGSPEGLFASTLLRVTQRLSSKLGYEPRARGN
ncbi:MAG: IclR family transcriptional regulator [Bauldia sp.]|nr:IclR family transcriptional regulator [Bauldia sp.]